MVKSGLFDSALDKADAEDQEIIDLYYARNENAITRTGEKYGKYLNAVSMNILKDMHDAEECVNDTYFRAWQTIPPERPSVLSAFLAKITRNLSLDRYRARYAGKRIGGEYAVSLDELADSLADGDTLSPERILDEREMGESINRFLHAQKKFARQIFVCRYFYADSYHAIARRFGVSESMIKSSLLRTRKKLKDYLKKEGFLI